jgi:iron complex transport system substrate-binding protein
MHRLAYLFPIGLFFSHWIAAADIAVNDDAGRRVVLEKPAQRIISLAPHTTELLFAAGAGSRIVGVVSHSNYPPEAQQLPVVGSAGNLSPEAIVARQPDLVVAWKSGNVATQVEQLINLGIPVFYSEPRRLEDIATNLQRLGRLSGTSAVAEATAREFRADYRQLIHDYSGRAPVRTFYQIWDQPLITVNGAHLISQLITLCGGENIFAALDTLAPVVNREAVLAADPQIIIASGEARERPDWLERWQAWPQVSAVRNQQLYVIDPDLIQRQAPRILGGAKIMCRQIERARQALREKARVPR